MTRLSFMVNAKLLLVNAANLDFGSSAMIVPAVGAVAHAMGTSLRVEGTRTHFTLVAAVLGAAKELDTASEKLKLLMWSSGISSNSKLM